MVGILRPPNLHSVTYICFSIAPEWIFQCSRWPFLWLWQAQIPSILQLCTSLGSQSPGLKLTCGGKWWRITGRRLGRNRFGSEEANYFCSNPGGQNSVTWSWQTAKEAGKFVLKERKWGLMTRLPQFGNSQEQKWVANKPMIRSPKLLVLEKTKLKHHFFQYTEKKIGINTRVGKDLKGKNTFMCFC